MALLQAFDVNAPAFQSDPWSTYALIHARDLILKDSASGAFFVGRHAQVRHVLGSPGFTTQPLEQRAQPVLGARVLAQMEGAEHAAKRRAVLSQLTARRFREFHAARLARLVDALASRLSERRAFDLMSDFGSDYSILATLLVLGLPTDRHQEVARWQAGVSRFVTSLVITDAERETAMECSRHLIAYLTPWVEAQAAGERSGLIGELCDVAVSDERMTVPECVALVMNLLLAASEPADKTLGYLFHHLLSQPELFAAVVKDRALLSDALDETLRMTPPVHLIPRQIRDDGMIDGVAIPAGSIVFCMIGAANRDPSVYEDPDRFILRRAASPAMTSGGRGRHLAFGAGPHMCVGAAFSLMQLELTANALIDRFPGLSLEGSARLQENGVYTRGPTSVRVLSGACPTGDGNGFVRGRSHDVVA